MARLRVILAICAVMCSGVRPSMATAGAPREGDRFVNPGAPRQLPGFPGMLPFFLRKAWTSLVPRGGAAPLVPFDRRAIMENPSITWIGHSTMLVRMDGVTFLTDPIFSDRASPVAFAGPKRHVPPGVPLDALPPIDFDATELDWWDETTVGSVRVHCVPAQHFCGRSIADGNRRLWAGWVIEGATRRFYHAGDTGYFAGFAEIHERLGRIDLAAIPIGAYDPPSIMRSVHINPEEAIRAAVDLDAGHVIGMHFGTFDLTDEPLDEPPRRFHAAATTLGLGAERAWTLNVGETRRW